MGIEVPRMHELGIEMLRMHESELSCLICMNENLPATNAQILFVHSWQYPLSYLLLFVHSWRNILCHILLLFVHSRQYPLSYLLLFVHSWRKSFVLFYFYSCIRGNISSVIFYFISAFVVKVI